MSYEESISDFENALWDMFNHVLQHDRIYFERTNFVKPDESFVTIRIADMTPMEREGVVLGHGPDGRPETYLGYRVVVDIKAYRGKALATGSLLRHALSMRELRRRYLNDNNIGYLHSSTISDSTSVLDDERWEPRSSFVSIFHMLIKMPDVYGSDGSIERVLTNETIHDTIETKYDGSIGTIGSYIDLFSGVQYIGGTASGSVDVDIDYADTLGAPVAVISQAGEVYMYAGEPNALAQQIAVLGLLNATEGTQDVTSITAAGDYQDVFGIQGLFSAILPKFDMSTIVDPVGGYELTAFGESGLIPIAGNPSGLYQITGSYRGLPYDNYPVTELDGTGAKSLSFWVYTNNTEIGTWALHLASGEGFGAYGNNLNISNNNAAQLWIHFGGRDMYVQPFTTSASYKWIHILVTIAPNIALFDIGTSVKVYVDGVYLNAATVGSAGDPLTIETDNYEVKGQMTAVRLYNTELTAQDAVTLYNGGVPA